MKTRKTYPTPIARALGLVALLAAGALLAACGKSDSKDDHAAHGHGNGHPNEAEVMAGFVGVNHTHETAGETCFICDASKRDSGRLWCREHGRYEDRCWLCHPELEDKARLFCKEHGLYEDECHLCRPEVADQQTSHAQPDPSSTSDTAAKAAPGELWCNEHGVAERECGICQPDLAASMQPGDNLKVRFPSQFSADKVGIRTETPQAKEVQPSVAAYCETQYNLNAFAKITPLTPGVVSRVHRDLGETVAAGDPLLQIHSADVAQAKSAYLSAVVERDIARKAFDRLARLQAENIAAEKDLLRAEAEYRSARLAASNQRQRLANLGLSPAEIETVEQQEDTSALLTIRAPFDGTLVARDAVVGEAVAVGRELFTLADLSQGWLELSIPADSADSVQIGQPVTARFAELPDRDVKGRIVWVDTAIDPQSRMVRARAVVDPQGQRLTAGLFGQARIVVGDSQSGAVLPRSAVQRHEGAAFVFVRDTKDLFALRRVALGASHGDQVEVLAGLDPRDQVVTEGSFIAMSEFLKSRLGAGCVH